MNIKEYIYSTSPQVFNPDLAELIGLNEAIIFQQIIYWCRINKESNRNFHDGHYWCYNSYREWQENNFKYFSESTIKRAITNLESTGLLITGNYNKLKIDKTKWYRPNFDFTFGQPSCQNDLSIGSKDGDPRGQIEQSNTRDYTENNSGITQNNQASPEPAQNLTNDLKEIFDKANINLTGKKLSWTGKEKEYGRNLQLIIKASESDFAEIKKRASKLYELVKADDWHKKQGFTPSSLLSNWNKLADINRGAKSLDSKEKTFPDWQNMSDAEIEKTFRENIKELPFQTDEILKNITPEAGRYWKEKHNHWRYALADVLLIFKNKVGEDVQNNK